VTNLYFFGGGYFLSEIHWKAISTLFPTQANFVNKKAFLWRKQKRESWHMSRTLFLWCLASVNQHLFTSTISNCLRTNKYYIVAGLSYQIFLNFEKFAYKRKKLRFNRLTHSWCRNDPWSCLRMYRCKVNVIWPGKYFLQRKMIIVCSPQ